ncbi:MAG: hypothetical protein FJ104_01425 [Deltaproteobacteria bacterium]|nr:hypothetical protein [Deltaproteobacteria bacterium]
MQSACGGAEPEVGAGQRGSDRGTGGTPAAADGGGGVESDAGAGGRVDAGDAPVPPCVGCPVLLADDQDSPGRIVLDRASAYWTTARGIMTASLTGGDAVPVASISARTWDRPPPLAVADGWLYVEDPPATIRKVPVAGSAAPSSVVWERAEPPTGTPPAVGLTVDARNLYWAPGEGGLYKIPLDGGAPVQLASVRCDYPGDLAVDASHVYCVTQEGDVVKVPIEPGPPTTLVVGRAGAGAGHGMAIDRDQGYWIDYAGRLMRVPLAGGESSEIASYGPPALYGPGSGVARGGAELFWGKASTWMATGAEGEAAMMDGALLRTTLDGVTTLVADKVNPLFVAAFGGNVCWTALRWMIVGDKGFVMCLKQ